MMLHPEAQLLLEQVRASGWVPRRTLTPEAARLQLKQTRVRRDVQPIAEVRDIAIAGPGGDLCLRLYRPSQDTELPVMVFLHGGGWVLGDLDLSDAFCREMAIGADCLVVSVDYRLAPEHRFPCAVEDTMAALWWVHDHASELGANTSAVAISGISAGGNLAAACALQVAESSGPALAAQILICPVLDHNFDRTSYVENASGMLLERDDMVWFWEQYLPAAAWGSHPHASPLRAPSLERLPPTVVITAEHDPLRDEGAAYAARLRAAGIPVRYRCYEGMIHGFVGNPALTAGRDAMSELVVDVRLAFQRDQSMGGS